MAVAAKLPRPRLPRLGGKPPPTSRLGPKPPAGQTDFDRDPGFIVLRAEGLRQMLRDGTESQRLRAAIAIMKLEMARMRGEWSPDGPSIQDTLPEEDRGQVECEPTPAALEARKQPPPFTHHETAFGRPKPSRPRFAENEPRPELEPQFC